jgi:homopolymeric O-antigen transport system permease protein
MPVEFRAFHARTRRPAGQSASLGTTCVEIASGMTNNSIAKPRDYANAIWRLRYFWLSLVKMDLRTRYRRSFLGIGWSMLHPLAMTAVICTVFHKLFDLDIREYGPSLMAGLCFWNFVSTCTTQGCRCLYQGEPYIRQYPAPIAIYSLRVVLGAGFHFLFALVVVIGLRWAFLGFDNLVALPMILPMLVVLFVFGWAISTVVSFVNVYFPDTEHICEVLLQVLFYLTPIIYPAEMLRKRGLDWLIAINPMANLLELVRRPILMGEAPSLYAVAASVVTALAIGGAATLMLRRFERKIIFQL